MNITVTTTTTTYGNPFDEDPSIAEMLSIAFKGIYKYLLKPLLVFTIVAVVVLAVIWVVAFLIFGICDTMGWVKCTADGLEFVTDDSDEIQACLTVPAEELSDEKTVSLIKMLSARLRQRRALVDKDIEKAESVEEVLTEIGHDDVEAENLELLCEK